MVKKKKTIDIYYGRIKLIKLYISEVRASITILEYNVVDHECIINFSRRVLFRYFSKQPLHF